MSRKQCDRILKESVEILAGTDITNNEKLDKIYNNVMSAGIPEKEKTLLLLTLGVVINDLLNEASLTV